MKDKPKDFLANEHKSTVGKVDYGCEVYGGPPQPTAKFSATELEAAGYRGIYRLAYNTPPLDSAFCRCSLGEKCDTGIAVEKLP